MFGAALKIAAPNLGSRAEGEKRERQIRYPGGTRRAPGSRLNPPFHRFRVRLPYHGELLVSFGS